MTLSISQYRAMFGIVDENVCLKNLYKSDLSM